MQEELERKSVSVTVQAAKLTGRVMRAAVAAALRKIEKERTTPKVGRNSMRRLTAQTPDAHKIEVEDRIRSFERYAKKYKVRYHVEKDISVSPPKWTVEHTEIFLHFLAEKMRHFNGAVAFLCFRCSNYIFPVQTLIGLVDRDRFFVKIEISGSQRQQLPLTNTAPVEHFKGVKGNRLIHHLKGKLLVFFPTFAAGLERSS